MRKILVTFIIILTLFFFCKCIIFGTEICENYQKCIDQSEKYYWEYFEQVNKLSEKYGKIDDMLELSVRKAKNKYEKVEALILKTKYYIIKGDMIEVMKSSKEILEYDNNNSEALNILLFNEMRIADLYKKEVPEIMNNLLNKFNKYEENGIYFDNMYFLWAMVCMENCKREKTREIIEKSYKYDKNVDKNSLKMFKIMLEYGIKK